MQIRVLVAEDSPTIRQHLAAIVGSDPRFQIVGMANDGLHAVHLTDQLRPDVVTMDIVMPGIDGVEATQRIMSRTPTPIVVISSATTGREAEAGFRALKAGAVDIVEKPSGLDVESYNRLRRRVLDTIFVAAGVRVVRRWNLQTRVVRAEARNEPERSPCAVGICSSTGGPPALEIILRRIDRSIPAPILIVQHMTDGFTQGFVDWLNNSSRIPVSVACDGQPILPGHAYVAPDDRHLIVSPRRTIGVTTDLPIGHHRPSGDALFTSLGAVYGGGAIGVILTGMGRDGCSGLRAVREQGGRVIAQDELTSLIFGMPQAAITAGVVDAVLPINAIAGKLLEMVGRSNIDAGAGVP